MNTATNPMMTSTGRSCKKWGLACPFYVKSTLHSSPQESDWSDEDWDGDRQRAKELKKKADSNLATTTNTATTAAHTDVDCLSDTATAPICKLYKTIGDPCPFEIKPDQPTSHLESEDWTKEERKSRKNEVPTSLLYDPTFKQDPLPYYTPKEKLAMDLDYYPPNYIPEEEDSAPSLVNNLVPPPVEEQKKNGEGTIEDKQETENKELEDIQDKDKKTTEEDSDGEIDREDDYSDSDFIY